MYQTYYKTDFVVVVVVVVFLFLFFFFFFFFFACQSQFGKFPNMSVFSFISELK